LKRLLASLTVVAAAATLPLAAAEARNDSAEATLRSICHRTSSASRPYVKLRVTAAQQRRHLRHAADIVPAPRGACPRTVLTATSGGTAINTVLTGETEVPAGDPVGTGEAVIRVRRGQGQLCFTIEARNITLPAAAAHIHRGGAGEAGPIVVPLRTPNAQGQARGCVNVSRATVAQILASRAQFYVNVHTSDFPGGAVRGQLAGTDEDDLGLTITVTMSGAAECNAAGTCNLGDADGSGTAVVRLRQGNVCYRVRVQNIELPSVGTHIHRGARTSAGGIVVQMDAPGASGVSAGCTATPQELVNEIRNTPANFYVNVHTRGFPAGAVRGQLG
jgi:hypothetical protein